MSTLLAILLLLVATAATVRSDDDGNVVSDEEYDAAEEGNSTERAIIGYCVQHHFHDVVQACNVVTEMSANAIVGCGKELDIKLPCFLLAICERGDWEKCSEIEDEEETWNTFVVDVAKKCMVRCVWQKMGFMDGDGKMVEEAHVAYLNTHFFNRDGKGEDMTDDHKKEMQACMDAPLPFHPFRRANLTEEEVAAREPGCELAEHSLMCSLKQVHVFVLNCIKEECFLRHQKAQAADKVRRSVDFLTDNFLTPLLV